MSGFTIMERLICQRLYVSRFRVPTLLSIPSVDTDLLLFRSLLAVIVVAAVWPLAFVGYLLTVYGTRIWVW